MRTVLFWVTTQRLVGLFILSGFLTFEDGTDT